MIKFSIVLLWHILIAFIERRCQSKAKEEQCEQPHDS